MCGRIHVKLKFSATVLSFGLKARRMPEIRNDSFGWIYARSTFDHSGERGSFLFLGTRLCKDFCKATSSEWNFWSQIPGHVFSGKKLYARISYLELLTSGGDSAPHFFWKNIDLIREESLHSPPPTLQVTSQPLPPPPPLQVTSQLTHLEKCSTLPARLTLYICPLFQETGVLYTFQSAGSSTDDIFHWYFRCDAFSVLMSGWIISKRHYNWYQSFFIAISVISLWPREEWARLCLHGNRRRC